MGLSSRASEWYVRFIYGFTPVPADEQHLSAYLHDVKTFMQALLVCANGDGNITAPERDWVMGFCSAMGGSEAMCKEIAAYPADEDIETVVNRGHQVSKARHSASDLTTRGDSTGPTSVPSRLNTLTSGIASSLPDRQAQSQPSMRLWMNPHPTMQASRSTTATKPYCQSLAGIIFEKFIP